jgi:hypothetical protein
LVEDRAEGVDHGLCEGVEFLGAGDFDVGDVGGGEGEVEVWLFWVVGGSHVGWWLWLWWSEYCGL